MPVPLFPEHHLLALPLLHLIPTIVVLPSCLTVTLPRVHPPNLLLLVASGATRTTLLPLTTGNVNGSVKGSTNSNVNVNAKCDGGLRKDLVQPRTSRQPSTVALLAATFVIQWEIRPLACPERLLAVLSTPISLLFLVAEARRLVI